MRAELKCRKKMYQAHKYISKNLRLLRYINDYTQDEVAECLGMSRTCYWHIESGSKTPDLITIHTISEFYDISIDYLLSFDITEQMISLLKRNKGAIEAENFMENYLKLSYGSREHIRKRIELLMKQEEGFNIFPWDYDKYEGLL